MNQRIPEIPKHIVNDYSHDLLLADISAERLSQTEAQLRDDGYLVHGCVAGDLADPAVIGKLMEGIDTHGRMGVLLHTAGVSSGMAEWQRIIRTNVVGTRLLLDAIESRLQMGSVAVLIASIAGHLAPADREVDALLASNTPTETLVEEAGKHLQRLVATGLSAASFAYSGLSGPAYGVPSYCASAFCATSSAIISPSVICTVGNCSTGAL